MTSQDDAIDTDRPPPPPPYRIPAAILEFIGYSSAFITILGYFVGPFPEIIPPPWRIPLVVVGFLAVLVAASITSARATTRYLSHFDVSLTKHLDDFKSDVGNALEEATSVQANAEAMRAAAIEAFRFDRQDVARIATPELLDDLARTSLGLRLQRARIAKGLSQEALAHAAGISTYTYQKFEKGESRPGTPMNPRLRTLIALAAALDMRVEELVGGMADTEPGRM